MLSFYAMWTGNQWNLFYYSEASATDRGSNMTKTLPIVTIWRQSSVAR